jgi:hypothetical protein
MNHLFVRMEEALRYSEIFLNIDRDENLLLDNALTLFQKHIGPMLVEEFCIANSYMLSMQFFEISLETIDQLKAEMLNKYFEGSVEKLKQCLKIKVLLQQYEINDSQIDHLPHLFVTMGEALKSSECFHTIEEVADGCFEHSIQNFEHSVSLMLVEEFLFASIHHFRIDGLNEDFIFFEELKSELFAKYFEGSLDNVLHSLELKLLFQQFKINDIQIGELPTTVVAEIMDEDEDFYSYSF